MKNLGLLTLLALTALIALVAARTIAAREFAAAGVPVSAVSRQAAPAGEIAAIENTEVDCPFVLPEGEVAGQTIVCGELTVPENWAEPDGRTIDITYTILKSPNLSPFPDAVVYLEGGPGSSALANMAFLSQTFHGARQFRDVILFDQRGTAYSAPLFCPSTVADEQVEVPEEMAGTDLGVNSDIEALTNNARRSSGYRTAVNCAPYFTGQGVDLSQYGTAGSVLDTIALLDALDYDAYNLHAISYGTNVALELMRYYEASGVKGLPALRSAIIDGNVPPNIDTRGGQATITPDNILRVFEDCAALPECAAAYPDIRQRAIALIRSAAEAPLEVDGETIALADLRRLMGNSLSLVADGNSVIGIGAAYLPLMVDELERGVATTYIGLRDGKLPAAPATAPATESDDLGALSSDASGLAADARKLSDELAALNRSRERLAAAKESEQPWPAYFINEFRLVVSKLDSLSATFLPAAIESTLAGDLNAEALVELGKGLSPELGVAAAEMTAAEVAQTFDALRAELPRLQVNNLLTNSIVTCNDRYESLDIERIFEGYRAYEVPELLNKIDVAVNDKIECEAWGLTPEGTDLKPAVVTDLPILVSNGSIDPETSVEWGEAAAEGLTNHEFVTFAYYPHGASTQFDCGPAVAAAFLMYPERAPDTGCARNLQAVNFPFVLPAQP